MLRPILNRGSLLVPALLLLLGLNLLACGMGSEQPVAPKRDSAGIPDGLSSADLDFDLAGLPPRLRDELKEIKILIIKDANIDDIWRLSDKPERQDIVVLACSAALLSTDMLINLKKWASEGHGILVSHEVADSVWPYFSPQGILPFFYMGAQDTAVIEGSVITEHVSSVQNFLWCAANSGRMSIRRSGQDLNHDEVSQILASEREKFIPIVVQGYDERGTSYLPLVLFATTWKGARIAWLSSNPAYRSVSDCDLLADDARLWSNLAHWLAGK